MLNDFDQLKGSKVRQLIKQEDKLLVIPSLFVF